MGALMAVNAVADAVGLKSITETLDTLDFPPKYRWIFAPIKTAAAIGLCSVTRFPALARLTTAMLTIYFALAVGAHIRARDLGPNMVPAAALLANFAAMTVKGPSPAGG